MISNCGHDENGRYYGGRPGDQTGGEWSVIPWYNRPWNVVLRHPDAKVREELAWLARRAADNNRIGYDQGQRLSYWQHLRASNYDPAQITVNCEADCSSGIAANVKAAGFRLNMTALQNVNAESYTGNLRAALSKAGFQVLTNRKYLISDNYLLRGDIPLYEGHHTVTNLANGALSGVDGTDPGNGTNPGTDGGQLSPEEKLEKITEGQRWFNSAYGQLLTNACGALLKIDGDYGPASRWAALAVWKYEVNKRTGTDLTPSDQNFGPRSKDAAENAILRIGDGGPLVYVLQFILVAKNYYRGAMDADFGAGTQLAVREFQRNAGLYVDGLAGPNTWNQLFN